MVSHSNVLLICLVILAIPHIGLAAKKALSAEGGQLKINRSNNSQGFLEFSDAMRDKYCKDKLKNKFIFYTFLETKKKPISEGERLYRAKCASCHRLLSANDYSYEKFKEYVVKYAEKLDEDEKKKMLEYLKDARPR